MSVLSPQVAVAPASLSAAGAGFHKTDDGILIPRAPVEHREEEYNSATFETLFRMQESHFWYQGRHRFLLNCVRRVMKTYPADQTGNLRAVDLGGGCGGWVHYLSQNARHLFPELALADSSLRALQMAGRILGPTIGRYQVDLLNLQWTDYWDAVFLLDVLEHIPQDEEALRQIAKTVRPGGYLFVTTPALQRFWSYNDTLVHHVRRYSRQDFAHLAARCGLELCLSRYFMFFLSPLLVLSRFKSPNIEAMTPDERQELVNRTHRVPPLPANALLRAVFSLETPLGVWFPFPWGTSILGVFRRA